MINRRGEIEILRIASRFRQVCECYRNEIGFGGRNFPKYCCGIASRLLAKYLSECGYGTLGESIRIKSGQDPNLGENGAHSWILIEGTIIDLTADQFDLRMPTVYMSREAGWYERFNHDARWEEADFEKLPGANREYRKMYEVLKAYMESEDGLKINGKP
jgi:hypothetical protein